MGFFRRKIKTYYGLDVGNGAIKLVELRHDANDGSLALQRFLVKPTPPEAVQNGVIRDKAELQGAIKALLRELRVRSLPVATVLTGQNLIVRQVEIPNMPADEFKKVLQLQADHYFGIPAEELAADFQVLRQLPQNRMQVLLVGSLKQPIMDFVDLLHSCGVRATRVDIEPLAALRSLRLTSAIAPMSANEATVVLDMGAGTSNLSIFQGDELQLVRVIGVAGNDFTQDIASGLQVSWQKAEELKFEYGVEPESPIFPYIKPTLERLLRQVSISLEFYQVENRPALIRQMSVIGGGSRLIGLIPALSNHIQELYTRLEMELPLMAAGNPCAQLTIAAEADVAQELGPILAVAIGLALGEVVANATD